MGGGGGGVVMGVKLIENHRKTLVLKTKFLTGLKQLTTNMYPRYSGNGLLKNTVVYMVICLFDITT